MSDRWEEIFAPSPVPGWLLAFDEDPERAVDSLLWGRFYFGHLQAAEPADLLIDWGRLLGDEGDFIARLDAALAAWVARHWGIMPESRSAARVADAWSRLAEVVACLDRLQATAGAFRDRFEEAREYLGPLSPSAARDPHGRYLAAVAEHQTDRSLAPEWWRLCDLPDGVPFFHGRYAIAGLSGLPPLPEEEEAGGFRAEVVRGIVRLARAYRGLIERKALDGRQAESEFMGVGHLTIATFPFPELWCEVMAPELGREQEAVVIWLKNLVPGLRAAAQKEARRPRNAGEKHRSTPVVLPGPDWVDRSARIAGDLRKDSDGALPDAAQLLAEQKAFAEATGESYYLVRSLCRFSSTLASLRPNQAVTWAEEAITWEPSNPYSWTTLTKACLRARRVEEAMVAAWQAVERFPEDAVARNGLGEVLKAQGRLSEAEAVYRETVERFPDNAVARTGLGEVLKAQGRLSEAEAVYRETVERFPRDAYARTGLANVLKALDRLEESAALVAEAEALAPESAEGPAARYYDSAPQVFEVREPTDLAAEGDESAPESVEAPSPTYAKGEPQVFEVREPVAGPVPPAPAPVTTPAEPSEPPEMPESEVAAPSPRPAPGPIDPKRRRDRQRRAMRTSEARLYRRWARRAEESPNGDDPAALRARAEHRLDEVLRQAPLDTRALNEKSLLLIDSSRFEQARAFVAANLERRPAVPALLSALARAERETAHAEHRSLDQATTAELLAVPHRLRAVSRACEPLVRLQEARAYLALSDGDLRRKGAARALKGLQSWIRSRQGKPEEFEPWFGQLLLTYVLAPVPADHDVEASDVDAIEECLERNARLIDGLEEDFGVRLLAA